jgi:hypothetical protein
VNSLPGSGGAALKAVELFNHRAEQPALYSAHSGIAAMFSLSPA